MAKGEIRWHDGKVLGAIKDATEDLIEAIAYAIEAQTKVNINQTPSAGHTGLIDTGFYLNSVYVVTPRGDSYGQTDDSGSYKNREGQMVERRIAGKMDMPSDAAAVVVIGAEYAIYLEIDHAPLYRAAEQVIGSAGELIEKI